MKQTLSERQIIQLAQQEDALLQNKRTYLGNLENALIDVLKSIASLKIADFLIVLRSTDSLAWL